MSAFFHPIGRGPPSGPLPCPRDLLERIREPLERAGSHCKELPGKHAVSSGCEGPALAELSRGNGSPWRGAGTLADPHGPLGRLPSPRCSGPPRRQKSLLYHCTKHFCSLASPLVFSVRPCRSLHASGTKAGKLAACQGWEFPPQDKRLLCSHGGPQGYPGEDPGPVLLIF